MRATNTPARQTARKGIMKSVRGYHAGRHAMYRRALQANKRAENQAYIGRKLKKRQYRSLWITRINIAARNEGISYSRFMSGLAQAGIELDRKQLSELAIHEPAAFTALAEKAKAALPHCCFSCCFQLKVYSPVLMHGGVFLCKLCLRSRHLPLT